MALTQTSILTLTQNPILTLTQPSILTLTQNPILPLSQANSRQSYADAVEQIVADFLPTGDELQVTIKV